MEIKSINPKFTQKQILKEMGFCDSTKTCFESNLVKKNIW